jgi:hypothetical protein
MDQKQIEKKDSEMISQQAEGPTPGLGEAAPVPAIRVSVD